jgi:hypothetical protein
MGWRDRAAAIDDHVRAIKGCDDWTSKIHQGMSSDDPFLFGTAIEAAKLFGIDTWDICFDRLQRGDDDLWYVVMQTDDPIRIDRLVRFAEERLPLEEIATGPADELGLGPQFRAHWALDFVLQDARRFPGKGWPLIRAGLQSPVTRNRNRSVRALADAFRTGARLVHPTRQPGPSPDTEPAAAYSGVCSILIEGVAPERPCVRRPPLSCWVRMGKPSRSAELFRPAWITPVSRHSTI